MAGLRFLWVWGARLDEIPGILGVAFGLALDMSQGVGRIWLLGFMCLLVCVIRTKEESACSRLSDDHESESS